MSCKNCNEDTLCECDLRLLRKIKEFVLIPFVVFILSIIVIGIFYLQMK